MNDNPYQPPRETNDPAETPLQAVAGITSRALQLLLPIAIVYFAMHGLVVVWKLIRFILDAERH